MSGIGGIWTLNWPQDGIVREVIGGVDLLIYKDRPRSIPRMFYDSASAQPDRTALICDDLRWSYKALEARVNQAAWTLKERQGIRTGICRSLSGGDRHRRGFRSAQYEAEKQGVALSNSKINTETLICFGRFLERDRTHKADASFSGKIFQCGAPYNRHRAL